MAMIGGMHEMRGMEHGGMKMEGMEHEAMEQQWIRKCLHIQYQRRRLGTAQRGYFITS
jgi:hypothetical protein